ncbi:hypothetical protein QTA58_03135 [Neorhizobium sp. CSC1952]|uniref:hypothetical protein n=2 Tax=Neorhizobium TaxID=1525371 RepID=UPI0025A601C7|nr:hypothetical protein [Rhizobium sp. CSC1952]WJR67775.1 hypothetical protein QTA58_03135 [Rhizobium sp. CSC1952]
MLQMIIICEVTIMTPLKFFLNLKALLKATETQVETQSDDPFRHPDIREMNLRQLADLPFPGIFRDESSCEKAPLAKCA